jgi:hypothetical protein
MQAFFSTAVIVGVMLVLQILPAHGEIYKWIDRNGKVHFTDNISAVPPEYRHQVEEKTSASPPARTPEASGYLPIATPAPAGPSAGTYTVPLHRVGNSMLVDEEETRWVTLAL